MSISKAIAPHLPFLRRFARALAGSQQAGDAYVAATLEVLVEDPSLFNTKLEPRIALYRTFAGLWNSLDVNLQSDVSTDLANVVDRKLESITPLPRQAFLLCSVEGFTPAEAAQILGVSEDQLDRLVEEAGQEIAQQVATDVLIIEDEPMIAMDLEGIVETLGHSVTEVARTHGEAVEAVKRHRPGLVLADIQLADGSSGLDAVNEILGGFEVPVIFITAYPDRLLTGERPEPAFLITKPYQPDTVKAIVSQALFFERKARLRDQSSMRA
ncbi:response regulator [Methyloligella sp. 2.7D]|uniref:response regulator n=1 Tax=unclassified Methyloligella TaxID=2625955 RepID=UPI00157D389F|nr:response regulator [Methyloligella sp. GL2]QKP77764.1 response regulator [Methyloligella sp. GL2]